MSKQFEHELKPFKGYTIKKLESGKLDLGKGKEETPKKEGVQEKGTWSGLYSKQITKEQTEDFYIKKSLKYPADNLSEVVTSDLLREVIGIHAISYDFVSSDLPEDLKTGPDEPFRGQGAEDYVVSQMREGSKTLKALVNERSTLSLRAVGANVFGKSNKKKIYRCLTVKQKTQLALILAGCALVLERDCQYGNIIFYDNPNDTTSYLNEEQRQEDKDVGKFDNGWGLAGICLPENARVDIFSSRQYIWSREGEGTGTGRGFPTNHFNDYPRIIQSQYFVKALEQVVKKSKENLTLESVKNTIFKIRNHFGKDRPDQEEIVKQKLFDLADHLGILTVLKDRLGTKEAFEEFKNKTLALDMESLIIETLSERLAERTESLNTLKVLLNMDFQYNPTEEKRNKYQKSDQKLWGANVPYDPKADLKVLKEHCLKIIKQIQKESRSEGEKVQGSISFDEVVKRLAAFNKDIRSFIEKTMKKYSEDRSLGSQGPDVELIQFFEDLLKGNTQALLLSSDNSIKSQRQSNAIILSNMTSRSPKNISRPYNFKRSRAEHEILPDPVSSVPSRPQPKRALTAFNKAASHSQTEGSKPSKNAETKLAEQNDHSDQKDNVFSETPYTASAHNKALQSLENIAKSIIQTMDADEESKGKISYKTINIKKNESFVVMQVEKKDSVILRNDGNRIQLEAKPITEESPDIQSAINLQIKLFATALIETGDPTPVITRGTAIQVIALLEEIRKQNKKIHPQIHSSIQFDEAQQKQVDNLLIISHKGPDFKVQTK